MKTALIIGASRGIGLELVRQLLAEHWTVHATARTDDALTTLKTMGAQPHKLDVTHAESIAALGPQVASVPLDLVVYVAGVVSEYSGANVAPTAAEFDRVMHANVLGAMQCIPLLAPKVEASGGKFVFLTSMMGSIGESDNSMAWLYRVSKAALNMAVYNARFDFPKATLIAIHPGWVQTEMGGPNATVTPKDSVAGMLKVIGGMTLEDTGRFVGFDGKKWAW